MVEEIINYVLDFCQGDRNYLDQIIEQLKDIYYDDNNWDE